MYVPEQSFVLSTGIWRVDNLDVVIIGIRRVDNLDVVIIVDSLESILMNQFKLRNLRTKPN
jgi:hypothetical protein